MTETDPRQTIETDNMSRFQWSVVAIMVGLLALDGFDVLSISFASPGIAADWGIDRAALGIVLSMELVGMSFGAIIFGRLADGLGRRGVILACLCIVSFGMFGASSANGVYPLCAWRVLTGLGLGGVLAATNAATAEVANGRFRALCIVLMAAGYPLGNVIGGSVAAQLLAFYDWRAIFQFGAVVSLLFIPVVWFGAPESINFLMHKRPPDALLKINAILARMKKPAIGALPPPDAERERPGFKTLLSGSHLLPTAALTFVYFAHIMTFYFILKWIPKIVADMGFAPSSAATVLVWASVGGLLGSVTLGLLTLRVRVFWLTVLAMLLSAAAVVWFGQIRSDLAELSMAAAIAGFVTNAGVVGIYAVVANAFPTEFRASGTGVVIGFGRGGSALAPALAGFLFSAGYGLGSVALLMALGSLMGAVVLTLVVRRIAM
ncbi:MFS transporter [Croceicoccus sp. YJ47]|uniref:MFS transporter n=1 Tax=Croceicoccus sp. YJ47 TaxID=2798724 RepID=UPI0019232A12|nr:MFS transporter [Croceicoccus sp. YJ47]QQN73543.1 MFS transporter [Croceicoccus sp. YJ47]